MRLGLTDPTMALCGAAAGNEPALAASPQDKSHAPGTQVERPVARERFQFPGNGALMVSCRIFYTEISDSRILLFPNSLVHFGNNSPQRHRVIHSVIQHNFKEDCQL